MNSAREKYCIYNIIGMKYFCPEMSRQIFSNKLFGIEIIANANKANYTYLWGSPKKLDEDGIIHGVKLNRSKSEHSHVTHLN